MGPDSSSKHLNIDPDDLLDPDERTNDIDEERRTEHDAEFYDGDKDQDGDTMPLPPISKTNGVSSSGGGDRAGGASSILTEKTDGNHASGGGNGSGSNEGAAAAAAAAAAA